MSSLQPLCPLQSVRGQNVLQAVDQLSISGLLVVCLRFLSPVNHLTVFTRAAETQEAASLDLRLRWSRLLSAWQPLKGCMQTCLRLWHISVFLSLKKKPQSVFFILRFGPSTHVVLISVFSKS